jgi:hypothetical protein
MTRETFRESIKIDRGLSVPINRPPPRGFFIMDENLSLVYNTYMSNRDNDNEKNLPEPYGCSYPSIEVLNPETPDEVATRADLLELHAIQSNLRMAWERVFCIDDVCKLANTSMKLIRMRRDVLKLPTGSGKDSYSKNFYEPLD